MHFVVNLVFVLVCFFFEKAQANELSFDLSVDNINIHFKQIALNNLSSDETKDMIFLSSDYDGIKSMFGGVVATALKAVEFFSPGKILELFINAYEEKYEKMLEDQKVGYHWLMYDRNKDNALMGNFVITTYVDDLPDGYNNAHLLELGLIISPDYRRQKIVSTITLPLLRHLTSFKEFQERDFCFDTSVDNIATHKIAKKIDAKLIFERKKTVDFILFKKELMKDLFVIETN